MIRQAPWGPQLRAAFVVAILSVGLSGCFDLTQRVAIDRDGAGEYQIAIAAQGLVGEALEEKPVSLGTHGRSETKITDDNGRVTQTTAVRFTDLSGLRLSDDLLSLHVLAHTFFGLGPTHVRFRRIFLVGNARRANATRMGRDGDADSQIMASVFGNHTYVFSVTLPGSILRIAPLTLGNTVVVPKVSGDFYHGHTVTWTMPLYRVLSQRMLTFEVDFSAYGSFHDIHSTPEGAMSL